MSRPQLVVIGAGGHARSCLDILLQNGEYEIAGCIDKCYDENASRFVQVGDTAVPVIGSDDMLADIFAKGIKNIFPAVGSNRLREKLFGNALEMGFNVINAISRAAVISPAARLGRGICVMPGAVVGVNTVIGDDCIINTNCSLDHDCKVGPHCHIAPGAAVSGTVTVGRGVQIGTGACVIDGINIGEYSFIGAGAAVVKDIPENVLAYGVPARVIKVL